MLSSQFVNEFIDLINSNYTALDFLRFVQDNYEAQTIIAQYYDEDEVRKVVWFIESHDDCEIESIIATDHSEYYDPEYGSLDPLSGWRIPNKKEIEDFEDYLQEGDDPLTWILRAIEDDKEQLENNLEEMFEFINGIPSIIDLRIGANVFYPGLSHYEFPIKFSYADINCEREKDGTISSISINIPFDICTKDIVQGLYDYISDNFPYKSRSATYSFDTSDKLIEVNIQLRNPLYKITMVNEENPSYVKSLHLEISYNRMDVDKLGIYKAFETIMTIKGYEETVWETLYSFIPDNFKE